MKARTLTLGGLTSRLVAQDEATLEGDGGPLVVLLHGFGAPGDDLVGLAGPLAAAPALKALPRAPRFLFPHAPLELGREYGAGRAWWPIDMMELQLAAMRGETVSRAREVPEGLASARATMIALLDEAEEQLGVAGEDLVLGGFSQGSMLACDVALHTARALAGLVVLSGTLLAVDEWGPRFASRGPGAAKAVPVFMSHGDADPILSFAQAEALRARFVDAGIPVRWVPFHGGHGIGDEALVALASFLAEALAR